MTDTGIVVKISWDGNVAKSVWTVSIGIFTGMHLFKGVASQRQVKQVTNAYFRWYGFCKHALTLACGSFEVRLSWTACRK